MVLPPVVVGWLLLIIFGVRGPVGSWLQSLFGIRLVFTAAGASLACAVMSFPLMLRAIRLSLEAVDPGLEQAARTLGAGPIDRFFNVTLPLAAPGVLVGGIVGFASCLGNFGAVITFAGSIPGANADASSGDLRCPADPWGRGGGGPPVDNCGHSGDWWIACLGVGQPSAAGPGRPMSLSVRFDHKFTNLALKIEFEAPTPGVTALFGPSGCGKSTVVMAVAGLLRPDHCRIVLDGTVLADTEAGRTLPVERRRIGMVFQDARLFPHMSVLKNLLFGSRRSGPGSIAFDDVVELLGIGHLLARRPISLSGGERQRVAIGRALLAQPTLLAMDEPLSSLDGQRKLEILPFLARLKTVLKLPILYVTHSTEELASLADTLVLLDKGQVVAAGPFEEIVTRSDVSFAKRDDVRGGADRNGDGTRSDPPVDWPARRERLAMGPIAGTRTGFSFARSHPGAGGYPGSGRARTNERPQRDPAGFAQLRRTRPSTSRWWRLRCRIRGPSRTRDARLRRAPRAQGRPSCCGTDQIGVDRNSSRVNRALPRCSRQSRSVQSRSTSPP